MPCFYRVKGARVEFGRTRNAVGTRADRRSVLDQINIFLVNL